MSQTVSDSWFRQFWSARPITLLVVAAVIALYVAVRLNVTPEHDRGAAFRQWGLLQIQQSAEHPELSGPFDLWAGEWWRVPLGGLHHAGWWHLGLVSLALLYLGGCLEPQLPKAVYGLFLLGAIFVTTVPRWLGGDSVPGWFVGNDPAMGLSGVVFALFGCLLMLRRNDPELANRFGEGAILIGIAVGLGSLAVSTIGLSIGLDNLAHLAGWPYGLLWGLVLSAPIIPRRILIVAIALAHAVLWSTYQSLIHPAENARYHWWLAETTDNGTEKQSHYEKALELDPSLEALWLELAELEFQTQSTGDAWRTLVRGFKENPNLAETELLSQRIWAAFRTKGRPPGRLAGSRAAAFRAALRLASAVALARAIGAIPHGRGPASESLARPNAAP